MAKSAAKNPAKAPKKSSSSETKSTLKIKSTSSESKPASNIKIDKACEAALAKLKALGIQQQLQNEVEWCLGSYRSDGNPVGLYVMAERLLTVFQEEKARKTKGVTAKTISDLEKVIAERDLSS